jgi:hypothetical protein
MSDPLKPLLPDTLPAGLERLARQAAASSALTERVRAGLPEPLRPHVLAAVRRGSDLVVIVDSAAWSARVRYAGRKLAEALTAAGETRVERVRVKVRGPERGDRD